MSNVADACFLPTGSCYHYLGQANRSDRLLRHFPGRYRNLFRTDRLFPRGRSTFRTIPTRDIMPDGAHKRNGQVVLRPSETALGVDQVAQKGHGLGEGRQPRFSTKLWPQLTRGPSAFLTQDSSFPSSHTQSVATLFSFLLLEGERHLPHTIWIYATFVTGCLTLLTGFSRTYLAMHFVSDVRCSLLFILPSHASFR